MHASTTAEANSAFEIKPSAPWRIAKVEAEPNYRLAITFMDGLTGVVDLQDWLFAPRIDGTVFEPLRETTFFQKARLELGAVTWPNGADLSPDAMYDAIQHEGRWAPK